MISPPTTFLLSLGTFHVVNMSLRCGPEAAHKLWAYDMQICAVMLRVSFGGGAGFQVVGNNERMMGNVLGILEKVFYS